MHAFGRGGSFCFAFAGGSASGRRRHGQSRRRPPAEITIDPEFRDLIQPLGEEELPQLEENLLAHGCRDPLVRWKGTGLLLDGHHRHALCTKHGISFRVVDLDMPDREAVKLWILLNQLGRRNLTDSQRAAMAHLVSQYRVAITKRERAAKGALAATRDDASGQFGRSEHAAASKRPEASVPGGTTRERAKAARAAMVSERQVRSVAEIEKAKPELVKEIVAGKLTVAQAKADVRKARGKEGGVREGSTAAPTDELGTPLPDREDVRQAFAAKFLFSRVLNLQSQLTEALNRLFEAPHAARALAPFRQRIESHCQNARTLIREYQPHALCPECSGTREQCGRCDGRGWLALEAWKRHNDGRKARASAAEKGAA